MRYLRFFLIFTLFIGASFLIQNGCGGVNKEVDTPQSISQVQAREFFSSSSPITALTFQVEFEDGAKPYFGKSRGINQYEWWKIFEVNMKKLFKKRTNLTLNLPNDTQIKNETAFSANPGSGLTRTINEILDLGQRLRQANSTTQRTIIVLFLNGYYEGNHNILGVSFGGTGTIAIFKEAIKVVSNSEQVEQSVLVHEAAHSLGLVNNGLPMYRDHEDKIYDPAKHAHCSNDQCVMFWSVNTVQNMPHKIKGIIWSDAQVLFEQECLDDVFNYTP